MDIIQHDKSHPQGGYNSQPQRSKYGTQRVGAYGSTQKTNAGTEQKHALTLRIIMLTKCSRNDARKR